MSLSSIGTLDYLLLHTTFDIFANEKSAFKCDDLLSRFDRFAPEERESRVKALREIRGCGGLPSAQHHKIDPFKLKTCPCTFQNKTRFGHIWTLFDKYERHGVLPFGGSLANQPAQILEAFDVLRNLKSSYETKQSKGKK